MLKPQKQLKVNQILTVNFLRVVNDKRSAWRNGLNDSYQKARRFYAALV
jgi:hypothetical protein